MQDIKERVDAFYIDTGCGNPDQIENYFRIKEYIAIYNLKDFEETMDERFNTRG